MAWNSRKADKRKWRFDLVVHNSEVSTADFCALALRIIGSRFFSH